MMDKGNGESSEIEEWMKEFLPDNIGIVKDEGVSLQSSCPTINPNQQNKSIAAMTPHSNSNMWQQHPLHRTSDSSNNSSARQNIATSNLPISLQGFSNSQTNTVSDLHHQHQLLMQNKALEKMNRGHNSFQTSMQSNTNYPCNYNPRQQHNQVQTSPMVTHHQETFNVPKSLERQMGYHLPQKNNITINDQLKPGNLLQNTRHGPLQVSESAPPVGSTNTVDWVDKACHTILKIKETYSSDLIKIFNKSLEVKRLATSVEELKKAQGIKDSSQKLLNFLQISRSEISRSPRERVSQWIQNFITFITVAKGWYNTVLQLEAQSPPQQTPHQQRINHLQFKKDAPSMSNSCHYNHQMWAPQHALGKLLHPSTNNNNNNNFGSSSHSQQIARNICNSFDYSVSPTNNKQQQQQDPSFKRQKMKQPLQQQLRRLVGSNTKNVSPQNSISSSSLCAIPSPSTPMADSAKSPLSSSLEESSKFPEISPSPIDPPLLCDVNELSTDTQCLLVKSPCAEQEPVKNLVDVVKSVSSGALTAALSEIKGIVTLNDTIGGQNVLGEPIKVIFRDLADDISNCMRGNFSPVNGKCMESRMKRSFEAIASDELSNETEFCSSDIMMKRQRREHIDMLMEEINEINEKLIEVVVDVSKRGSEEGTVVRCSYIPVGFSRNTSTMTFPNLVMELVVTADYPNSSPTVSESMPIGSSDEYMWMKAKSSFGLSLKKYSEPVSLKEMARVWDVCARKVFHEFAEQMGGGNFSSRYGNWDNCAVAAV